ncbi:hypothetical protein [uncultured Marinobacter sp.]|uniref:hypothetical protein n=1 Tax=uncultured Marinobacter sp. TaxID=187379 RepID=UPI0030D72A09
MLLAVTVARLPAVGEGNNVALIAAVSQFPVRSRENSGGDGNWQRRPGYELLAVSVVR